MTLTHSCYEGDFIMSKKKVLAPSRKELDQMEADRQKALPTSRKRARGSETGGIVFSNISSASTIYGEEKFHSSQGHGFAAERANTQFDLLTGHKACILGDDNARNGADRMRDGIMIQSKYCNTGGRCIEECFEHGRFRYWNPDGSPMRIEVPCDQYDSAVYAMRQRIKHGDIPGVSDPDEANNIVLKGHFSYEQVKNIAKAGTIESLRYDAANGMVIASSAFGVTYLMTFAASVWNGDSADIALKNAAASGLRVGGVSFMTAVFAGQLSKAGLNSMLVGSSEAITQAIGAKGSAVLVNAFRSGNNIYGAAAMKSASKMLRGNAITGVASVVILSTGDMVNMFRGRISGKQLFKNITNTAATVAGGSAGWVGGAAAGAAIGSAIPVVGTFIGGIAGGLVGSAAGGAITGKVSSSILDQFVEDDANEMARVLEQTLLSLTEQYLLTSHETEHVVNELSQLMDAAVIKNMYSSKDRDAFAKQLILPILNQEMEKRVKIHVPNKVAIRQSLSALCQDIQNCDRISQRNYT